MILVQCHSSLLFSLFKGVKGLYPVFAQLLSEMIGTYLYSINPTYSYEKLLYSGRGTTPFAFDALPPSVPRSRHSLLNAKNKSESIDKVESETKEVSSPSFEGITALTNIVNVRDVVFTYYADTDGDSFGDPGNSIVDPSPAPPLGYVVNNTDCPKGRDEVQIRVNMQPKVSAGKSRKVCQSQPAKLYGKLLSGKAQRFQWTSSGTGTFDDASIPDAIYTPSDVDAGIGAVRLQLKAYAYGVCMHDSEAIALTVMPIPQITLPGELAGKGTNPIAINAKMEGNAKLTWSCSGSGKFQSESKANTTYTPSNDDLAKGNITLTLKAKGEANCSSEKSILIKLSNDQ